MDGLPPKTMDDKTISVDDLQILREAMAQLNTAQTNQAFVEGFLARKYGLQNGDSIDFASGTICRTTSDSKEMVLP